MIQKLIALLIGLFLPNRAAQEGGATGAAGTVNSLAFYGAGIGFVTWLVGPGRDFEIVLRGWEIWAVVAVAAIAGGIFLRIEPPKGPGQ